MNRLTTKTRHATGLAMVALLASAAALPDGNDEEWEDHAAIRAAVVAAVAADLEKNGARIDITADKLDARLRLVRCAAPLAVTIPKGRRSNSRVTTEVQCAGPKAWRVFVPASVVVYQNVVVAARSLQRGSVLAPGDIIMAEQDTSSLPYGYLLQTDHAIGNRLRRDIGIGTPVSPSLLETPATVKRGQQVTLEAKAGGMIVRMAGVAKSDGIMGQVIPVENTRSQRVVHAVVRTGRTVEVLLQ